MDEKLHQQLIELAKHVIDMTLDSLLLSGYVKPEERKEAAESAKRRVCDRLIISAMDLLE